MCAGSPARAAATDAPFVARTLTVPAGRIHAVLSGAISDPPRRDIIVCADVPVDDGPARKICYVFRAGREHAAAAPPDARTLPLEAALVQCGDVTGDGRDDLTYLTPRGVFAYAGTPEGLAAAPVPVLETAVLAPPGTDRVTPGNYLVDLTNDARLDLLLPVVDGFAFHAQQPGDGFSARPDAVLPFPVVARLRSAGGHTWMTLAVPQVLVRDFDGDGRTDVAVMNRSGSYRFLQQADGTFTARRWSGDMTRDADIEFTLTAFGDWNGDGNPDAAFTRFKQRRILSSTLTVHLGSAAGALPVEPTIVFDQPGTLFFPVFLDTTGDGQQELLLYSVHFGFRFAVNYFLRNRIMVDVAVYPVAADTAPASRPLSRMRLAVAAFDSGAEPLRAVADVNGDGVMDMVVGLAPNRLAAFLGDPQTGLATTPAWTMEVDAYGRGYVQDLNGDGRDDLVVTYPDPERQHRATVLYSRAPIAGS